MKISNLDIENDLFSGRRNDDVAVLRFKNKPLHHVTDLDAKKVLFDYLDLVSVSDRIKVLLIVGAPVKMGCKEYIEFYRGMIRERYDRFDRIWLERMYNAVNQLVLRLAGFNKMVIHADSGNVILLFLSMSLACDYRLVADNTVFQNPNVDLGLAPKGGQTYFLSRMLGSAKTSRILLSGKDLSAAEAMKLGIVDEVVPLEDLDKAAIETARHYAKQPAGYVAGVKKLLNYDLNHLECHLHYEDEELRKVIQLTV